jgi:hypothetical protein
VLSMGLGRQLGEMRFAERAPRKLGEAAAQKELARVLAAEIVPWARESLGRIGGELAVEDLVVSFGLLGPDPQEYSPRLVKAIEGIDGVLGVQLVSLRRKEKSVAVRVLYYAQRVPNGLLYELALKHPELKLRMP